MALLDLKDVSQTLEILRRTRKDMPEGQLRDGVDREILALSKHITSLVGEDERLVRTRNAEHLLLAKKPREVDWTFIKAGGALTSLIAKVVAGKAVDVVWAEYLRSRKASSNED